MSQAVAHFTQSHNKMGLKDRALFKAALAENAIDLEALAGQIGHIVNNPNCTGTDIYAFAAELYQCFGQDIFQRCDLVERLDKKIKDPVISHFFVNALSGKSRENCMPAVVQRLSF